MRRSTYIFARNVFLTLFAAPLITSIFDNKMKTTLKKENKKRDLPGFLSIDEIANSASILPMKVATNYETVEATFCESISGGADEVDNMPRRLSLTRLKMIDGKLHTFTAEYIISKS